MNLETECFKVESLSAQEIIAFQSLETGEADAHQQRLALSVLLKKMCRTYDTHFLPGQPDGSAFLSGRGFVGQQVLKCMRLDPRALKQLREEEENG